MQKLGIALCILVSSCSSDVRPRSQADTRVDGPAHRSAARVAFPDASSASPESTSSLSTPDVTATGTTLATTPPLSHYPPPLLPGADTPPPTPAATFEPERACKKDDDCALVPDDCRECPPCEATWRTAANRSTVRRIVKARATVACPPIMCQQCWTPPPPGVAPQAHGYLGEAVECRAGQCVVKRDPHDTRL